MRKSIFVLVVIFATTYVNAQSYTIISRSNDTIRMQSNKLGDALKSVLPGKSSEAANNNYRLIEKNDNGKKSLLFVEFTQVLDKVFVTYETDLIHSGDWSVKTYSFNDIYNSTKRGNAIFLKGQLLGMNIEIYQRPDNFVDVVNIDGIEFPTPIKVSVLENKINQEAQNKNVELYKLGLTENDVMDSKDKVNECYIAYLIKSDKFNPYVDRTLINELCVQDIIKSLQVKYNDKQLEYLSREHDTRLNKYAK